MLLLALADNSINSPSLGS